MRQDIEHITVLHSIGAEEFTDNSDTLAE